MLKLFNNNRLNLTASWNLTIFDGATLKKLKLSFHGCRHTFQRFSSTRLNFRQEARTKSMSAVFMKSNSLEAHDRRGSRNSMISLTPTIEVDERDEDAISYQTTSTYRTEQDIIQPMNRINSKWDHIFGNKISQKYIINSWIDFPSLLIFYHPIAFRWMMGLVGLERCKFNKKIWETTI